jgi:hypothetical protein
MAMDATPASVAADGTETLPAGSLATAIYSARKARIAAKLAAISQPMPTGADFAASFGQIADDSTDIAVALVAHIQAHAQARITADATGDGLQRDSTTAPTTHPAANKFLPIV